MMKKLLFALSLLLFTIPVSGRESTNLFEIIPHPQEVTTLANKGIKYNELRYLETNFKEDIVLGNLLDNLPRSKRKGKGIILTLSNDTKLPESDEGYILNTKSNSIQIEARTLAGLFYGCQTLQQLMEDSRDFDVEIPTMRIVDYPAIEFRSIHLDTKNHLDRVGYYYDMIDRLARYKINAIIWELEDKLKYERRPEVAAPNAISKQEMQALARYAKDRHISIEPLVQGLGHAGFILKHHWELRENIHSDWEFCPADPRTYEVQFDLYRDALEALPYGKFLHIGGDEITAIGIDERCQASGKSPFELQMYWLNKVCQFAVDNGRTPIFWDDMPLKYAGLWNLINSNDSMEEINKKWKTDKLEEAISLFPKECIYMRWEYGDATSAGNIKVLDWYQENNLKVMGATAAASGHSTVLPRNNSMANYIQGFSKLIAKNNLEGILATSWDDGSPHLETVWRGYIAQGEYGWNPTKRTVDEYKKVHALREFGFHPSQNLTSFIDDLEEAVLFYDGALVTSGRRNPAWQTRDFTLIELPSADNSREWSEKYKDKISKAKQAIKEYDSIQSKINRAKSEALRNRYTIAIYEQINELIVYPSLLINSLAIYDSSTDKESALQELYVVCNQFNSMKMNLEKVYSKTRLLEQPVGYISDLNHHNHLAAKTNNTDWMYLYELPMVNKVLRWIKAEAQAKGYKLFK